MRVMFQQSRGGQGAGFHLAGTLGVYVCPIGATGSACLGLLFVGGRGTEIRDQMEMLIRICSHDSSPANPATNNNLDPQGMQI